MINNELMRWFYEYDVVSDERADLVDDFYGRFLNEPSSSSLSTSQAFP